MQILVASFQATAERVLRADKAHGRGRRGAAGVGLGQAAGGRRAPQPAADALAAPQPVLAGPGSRRQGAATRGDAAARAPGRSGRTEHQGPLKKGHGLDAAGSCGHENSGASADFPP